jgi:hypothetical protein
MPDPDRWIARQRDLVLYLAATCVTSIIQFGQGVAVGWFIYEKTDSELALGLVGLARISHTASSAGRVRQAAAFFSPLRPS